MAGSFYIDPQSAKIIKEVVRIVRAGKTSQRPTPTRRPPRGGRSDHIIYAAVNQTGGVTAANATFPFENAVAIRGKAPDGGVGNAQNHLGQAFDNGQKIRLERGDDGEWYTDTVGDGSGSPGTDGTVVGFEIIEDKSYADAFTEAKVLDEDGNIDLSLANITVLDPNANFYGKTAVGAEQGYQGHAVKVTDNYTPTGLAGYRIIDMEGPAHFMTGILAGSYSGGGTPFTPSTTQIWGRPSRGERLPATGSITVMDDDDVASDAQSGDKWLIAWNEAAENYTFVVNLGATFVVFRALVNYATGVASADATFTFDNGTSMLGTAPASGTCSNIQSKEFYDNEEILVFGNGTPTYYGIKLPTDWNELPGYVLGNKQTLTKDASAALPDFPEWVDSPQKVIWGIDPDAGHTITSSGTTLTLTLKVTKYTFDAVNFVSAVDADVVVNYTGTECP